MPDFDRDTLSLFLLENSGIRGVLVRLDDTAIRDGLASAEAASRAAVQAFEQALDLRFEPGDLTQKETSRTEELVREKYGSALWTQRA